ncbi:MATE family efflux transporter [Salegentibacter salegens]|uniref:Na+-driven multidrug efflux pump n=1 Tax=Salegentibacter salegens TaxID=143223 RepID=A0A1M7ILW8_9FLAO|nr:MATE family efflux transporter [Salegentibacter salegens]PRX42479.1 Na+-driven multidrug efflux pump [Salegentibacter salegens]SHM41701.1 Na+-driven multidrug efflux pump [Salegentibacter salegens]
MSSSKTIAKNTLFLYFRMFLVMGVTLYMSRIVLEQLGVSDFGIYSLVGGIVALFGFLNSSMSSATQRYLAFDLGKKDESRLQKTFSVTLTIHIAIAVIILFFAETIGLWYVNNKVVLPPDRLFAANIVYQFSVLTALIGIIQVPYDSLIIAYEKMNVYAYISIVEVCLKLGLVFLLVVYGGDKLIAYAAMMFLVSLIIRIAYQIYCRRNYKASKYSFEYDKTYFKELISYSGWNLFGGLASVSRGQGINIVLNLFFGTVVNAAYGLTLQVQSAVNQFVTNFQRAVNPQIIKTYSEGNLERMHKLVIQSSKFSFLLMLLIIAPILFNTDFILNLWLKNPPQYTTIFVQLSLIGVLVDCISGPLMVAVQATGKIKNYQILIGSLIILTLPLAAIWLYYGGKPAVVFYSIILINFLSLISRLFFLKALLNLKISKFLKGTFLRIVLVSAIVYVLFTLLKEYNLSNGWWSLIITLLISAFCVLSIGLSKSDYVLLKSFIKK